MDAEKVPEKQWKRRDDQDDPRRNLDSEGHVIPGTDADCCALGISPVKKPKSGFLA
jgi:hypothetical protein